MGPVTWGPLPVSPLVQLLLVVAAAAAVAALWRQRGALPVP
jgi:hypothetical protein